MAKFIFKKLLENMYNMYFSQVETEKRRVKRLARLDRMFPKFSAKFKK